MEIKPLIEGVTPTAASIDSGEFIVVAPDDHVLSEKEWSDLIGDNTIVMEKHRAPVSKYSIKDMRIFHSPFSNEALKLMEDTNK